MIDQRGIEVNLDKIQAILQMQSPTTANEVQRLTTCIVTLGRFMSRSVDKPSLHQGAEKEDTIRMG